MLILWDIDGTLITTSQTGMRAMEDAARELFGAGFSADGVEYAGRLDPLIVEDILRLGGVEATAERRAWFRGRYHERLRARLSAPGLGRTMPGVRELIAALGREPGVVQGLLTGNFAETGTFKLTACGLEMGSFEVCVWGDESPIDPPRREHLPAVGIRRYQERYGRPIESGRVVIIGDTPHDVACARAHGCRSIGVGTGKFRASELRGAGADLALDDLSDTLGVLSWIVSGPGLSS